MARLLGTDDLGRKHQTFFLSTPDESLFVAGVVKSDISGTWHGCVGWGEQWQVLMENLREIRLPKPAGCAGLQVRPEIAKFLGRNLSESRKRAEFFKPLMPKFTGVHDYLLLAMANA